MERELRCPHCGRVNDTHERPESSADPVPGDIGICWKCHGLAMLTPFGFLRGPKSPEEAAEWEAASDIKRARAAMSESFTPSQALRLFRGES